MRAISEDKIAAFEALGCSGIQRWLRSAVETYLLKGQTRWAFRPFELMVGQRDSLSSDIDSMFQCLSPVAQADFRLALVRVLEELEAQRDLAEVWRCMIELAWLLPAPAGVAVLERRFTCAFLNELCADDSGLFDHIFAFTCNTATSGESAERCIRRLVDSKHFNVDYSRLALLRLCEIAPDHWPSHFALTRDLLAAMFRGMAATLGMKVCWEAQEDMAKGIWTVIGFDRFESGLGMLSFDARADANDRWFWDALTNPRSGDSCIIIRSQRGDWFIAPQARPNDLRCVERGMPIRFSTLPPAQAPVSPPEIARNDRQALLARADELLGRANPARRFEQAIVGVSP
jgi:hypothetical protein